MFSLLLIVSVTLWYFLRLQALVPPLVCKHQFVYLMCTMFAAFAVASLNVASALVAAAANCPILRASLVHSLWRSEQVRGPKHDYCNLLAHAIDLGRALERIWLTLECLQSNIAQTKNNGKIQSYRQSAAHDKIKINGFIAQCALTTY